MSANIVVESTDLLFRRSCHALSTSALGFPEKDPFSWMQSSSVNLRASLRIAGMAGAFEHVSYADHL